MSTLYHILEWNCLLSIQFINANRSSAVRKLLKNLAQTLFDKVNMNGLYFIMHRFNTTLALRYIIQFGVCNFMNSMTMQISYQLMNYSILLFYSSITYLCIIRPYLFIDFPRDITRKSCFFSD